MAFSIVVIGTSLGGLKALSIVLRALPKSFPLPIAVVQHRTKNDDAGLAHLLSRQGQLLVLEPNDKQLLVPGYVYLAPADYHLLVEPKSLALSTEAPALYARPSIDVLFESAAKAHGSGVIGIILTGSNHDGARGVRCIKEHGGIVLVEDPSTAESETMPAAAIATMVVDKVLPLHELVSHLVPLVESSLPRPANG